MWTSFGDYQDPGQKNSKTMLVLPRSKQCRWKTCPQKVIALQPDTRDEHINVCWQDLLPSPQKIAVSFKLAFCFVETSLLPHPAFLPAYGALLILHYPCRTCQTNDLQTRRLVPSTIIGAQSNETCDGWHPSNQGSMHYVDRIVDVKLA